MTETLPKAHRLQQLPADYVDVTEGRLAPVKRAIKRKLLHNFKHGYVDVLSRQQSQVNGQLILDGPAIGGVLCGSRSRGCRVESTD